MNALRVVQMGLGPIGRSLVRLAAVSEGLRVVGAIDPDPRYAGKDLGEILGAEPTGLVVAAEASAALEGLRPDVVLHATGSFLREVADELRGVLSAGTSVVSTCEELSYPYYRHPDLAAELDALAKDRGVVLLGTGVNPGFLMDKLPATILAACRSVRAVRVRRVVDASKRREPLQRKIGAALTAEQFEERRRSGRLGHVGLAESAHMVADVIGVSRAGRSLVEGLRPEIAVRSIATEFLEVAAGSVAGINQFVAVEENGSERVRLELRMYLGAESPVDSIAVDGSPSFEVTIPGGVHGDEGTTAVTVSCACLVGSLAPGLRTMLDVPLRGRVPNRGFGDR